MREAGHGVPWDGGGRDLRHSAELYSRQEEVKAVFVSERARKIATETKKGRCEDAYFYVLGFSCLSALTRTAMPAHG